MAGSPNSTGEHSSRAHGRTIGAKLTALARRLLGECARLDGKVDGVVQRLLPRAAAESVRDAEPNPFVRELRVGQEQLQHTRETYE